MCGEASSAILSSAGYCDIDTGGDRAKADDVLYRAIAERTHRRRFSPKYQVVIDAIDAALAARKVEA